MIRKLLRRQLARRLAQVRGKALHQEDGALSPRSRGMVLVSLGSVFLLGCLFVFMPTIRAFAGQDPAYSTDKAKQEAQRKQYAEKVGQGYNFRMLLTAGIATRRLITSGSNLCIAIPSALRFTGQA
jgi:hypothetical protein